MSHFLLIFLTWAYALKALFQYISPFFVCKCFSLVIYHLYPPVCPRVIGLDGAGGAASAPASDSEQDLVRNSRPGTLRGLDHAVQLSDRLHIHQHLECVYDDRSTHLVTLHVSVVLDLIQQTREQVKGINEIVSMGNIVVLLVVQHRVSGRLEAPKVQYKTYQINRALKNVSRPISFCIVIGMRYRQ